MKVNSKDCTRGKCNLYPCQRKQCSFELAFNDKQWFIVKQSTYKRLNTQMKRRLYNEYRNQTLQS